MDLKLYRIAAYAVQDVYNGKGISIGSTQYSITQTIYNDNPLQVLAIAGTNGLVDWFHNLSPLFWDGVKLGNYLSAKRILKDKRINKDIPLLITTHSKSGPTGFYLNKILKATYCISFCPTPGLRKPLIQPNSIMFVDPDDIVPKIGKVLFNHPYCTKHTLPDDKGWFKISDHFMDHIIEYLNGLEN